MSVIRLIKGSGRGTQHTTDSNRLDQQSSLSTLKATPRLKVVPINTNRSSKNPNFLQPKI